MNEPTNKDFWEDISNFKPHEFDSPDQKGSGKKMRKEFIEKLQQARTIAGIPFNINSGYRTPFWNRKKGGVKSSEHCLGLAADIDFKPDDINEFWTIYNAAKKVGFVRIGLYFDNRDGESFIHLGVSKDHPQRSWAEWQDKPVSEKVFIEKMKAYELSKG